MKLTPRGANVERPDDDRLQRYVRRHRWLPDRPHMGLVSPGDVDAFGDESLYRPSRLGTASAEPSEVAAGESAPLRLTFTAGPDGVPEGARVTFVMRGQKPLGARAEEGFAVEGPPGCVLEPAPFGFVVKEGRLREGDGVVLTSEPFPWTPLAGRREFKVVLNYGKDRPERRLPEPVAITVRPRALDRLEATLPCTHRGGGELPLRITARDGYDNRVPRTGTVEVEAGGGVRTALMVDGVATCSVKPDAGAPTRAAVRIEPEGHRRLSNPSVAVDDLSLYVGDLHCHDFLSEAEGYPDEVYRWAVEDRRLDFVSVVPQSHGWHDNETWTVVKYLNERYLREGEFVTFLGFEWQHTGYGDKVIHYLGGDRPYLPVDDERYGSAEKLYAALRGSDAIVISHHPCYPAGSWCSSTDFDAIDTDVERLVELWSMHGSSEGHDPDDRPLRKLDPERLVSAALRRGVRLGFVAGSDTHSGRPGGSAKEPMAYWGGLAAVWAEDLTRRGLFEALRARRTYALTRARIVLKMAVNGAPMGAEIPASEGAEIRIDVWAPGSIRKVEVLKNTKLLRAFGPFGDACRLETEDATGGPAFYHCRVTQADGQLAVCSPVWVG